MDEPVVPINKIMQIIREHAVPDELDIMANKVASLKRATRERHVGLVDLKGFLARKDEMNAAWSLTMDYAITSRGGLIGKLIILFKRLVRKSIGWYLRPIVQQQQTFNMAATQTVNEMANAMLNINSALLRLEQMDVRIRKMSEGSDSDNGRDLRVGIDPELFDYVAFEREFRGEGAVLDPYLSMYVEEFQNCSHVIDLGCGHGDFLFLLQSKGIKARGCDLNADFVNSCRERGLDVEQTNALGFLADLEDESVDGILLSQVVEHLNYDDMITIFREAHSKMKPGGKIVIATLNPQNLTTFTNAFYADPTHIRMVHPETLQFILRQNGYSDIRKVNYPYSKIQYEVPLLSGACLDNLAEFNNGIKEINRLLFGYQDYTVIAVKE